MLLSRSVHTQSHTQARTNRGLDAPNGPLQVGQRESKSVRFAGCCVLTARLCAVAQVLGNIFGTKNTSEMETKATLDHLSQITQVANSMRQQHGGTPASASERQRGRWPSSDSRGMRCKRDGDG
jgi:hypothetical protein